jgi:hypothetical protein
MKNCNGSLPVRSQGIAHVMKFFLRVQQIAPLAPLSSAENILWKGNVSGVDDE